MLGSSFSQARLKSIGSVGNLVGDNDIQNLLAEMLSVGRASIALDRNERLECSKSLSGPFETDRPRFTIVFGCGLSYD